MFILKKICNASTNAPEPVRLPTGSDKFKLGALITLRDGRAYNTTFGEMPTHISGENALYSAKGVLCYELSPDFIFSAPINGDPKDIKVGDKLAILSFGDFADALMCDTAEGVATVVDLCGAKNHGDFIHVKFK